MAQVGVDLWVHLVLLVCSGRDTSRWVLKIPKEGLHKLSGQPFLMLC